MDSRKLAVKSGERLVQNLAETWASYRSLPGVMLCSIISEKGDHKHFWPIPVLSQSWNNSSDNNSLTSKNYKNFLCFNQISCASCAVNWGSLRRVHLPHLFPLPSGIFIYSWVKSDSAFSYQAKLSQLSISLCMTMFQSQHCLCGPSMDSLQHVPVSLLLRSLTLTPTVQMYLTRAEWKRRITSFLKNVGLPYHKDTSLIYGQLLVNQNFLNFSLRLFFQLVSLWCVRGFSFPDAREHLPLPLPSL